MRLSAKLGPSLIQEKDDYKLEIILEFKVIHQSPDTNLEYVGKFALV